MNINGQEPLLFLIQNLNLFATCLAQNGSAVQLLKPGSKRRRTKKEIETLREENEFREGAEEEKTRRIMELEE
jgi:hypothetical protein